MKKILVMPVKNEEWILEKTLMCASLWADHILVAYQESEDDTLAILKRFSKVVILANNAKTHNSNVRKFLLDAARQYEGQNAIFSFDADEIPTAHILSDDFWKKVEALRPGTTMEMQWVNLWRSPLQYRDDDSVWSNSWKQFGFIDDRKLGYKTLDVINDHTSRIPSPELQGNVRFDFPKVLHYQFVDWGRLMSKQAYYRITEYVQSNKSFWSALKINLKYYPSKDERGLGVTLVPEEWIRAYSQEGIDLKSIKSKQPTWFDQAILRDFVTKGIESFSLLDIWDIDWNNKQSLLFSRVGRGKREIVIRDPRRLIQRLFQAVFPFVYRVYLLKSYFLYLIKK